jgi:omega-hydroxy-beta-dihydromenaquinone-9 sulfotransferase
MRRILLFSFLITGFIVVEIFNWICLILDNIIFPAWRKTIIKAPVFIIGMPRTGTTWLQNVISADNVHFSSMKLWEILFAPSIIQKRFFLLLRWIDNRLNHFLTRPLRKLDKLAFKKYNPMHPTSFFSWGEDDLLLVHIFSGLFLIFLFPSKKSLNSIIRFDEYQNAGRNKRIIVFYKKCIQRHMYVFGIHKTYLSKSPGHTPKMKNLCISFPDSCFICTSRAPEEAIPSAISLFIRFCEVYYTPYDIKTLIERTFAMADYWYPHPLEVFNNLEEDRYIILKYEMLTNSIVRVVSEIYHRFGIELSTELNNYLTQQQRRKYQSTHIYSPEKYGLNAAEISLRYRNIYKELLNKSVNGN